MVQSSRFTFADILEIPVISRIRRNHGLEHATLHTLATRFPHTMLAGHSDTGGFWIIGEVPTDVLQSAVQEAMTRLKSGEKELAIHPNCGTNFVTAGALAGLSGATAMLGAGRHVRDKLGRLPLAAMMATTALILAQPLGLLLQARVTTSGDPGTLEVVSITQRKQGRVTIHRIQTRG